MGIDGVTVKSTAELIVDAALRHLLQGQQGEAPIGLVARGTPVTQEQRQVHGVGELRLGAKAAVGLIEDVVQFAHGIFDDGFLQGQSRLFERR